MPALIDLAYTTGGGIIGAAVTTYLARNHERRRLRAEVQQQLHRVGAVRDGICDIAPSPVADRRRPIPYMVGERLLATGEFGLSPLLEDGTDAERALRAALEDLIVAALSAGIPRRVLDFAGGGAERALQCEVIRLIDLRLGGVLGDEKLDALMGACDDYREATVQLLLRALWHPWQSRLRMHARIHTLRGQAATLHHRQQTAIALLARPEHTRTLAQRIGSAP
jgi:hypothetical protein